MSNIVGLNNGYSKYLELAGGKLSIYNTDPVNEFMRGSNRQIPKIPYNCIFWSKLLFTYCKENYSVYLDRSGVLRIGNKNESTDNISIVLMYNSWKDSFSNSNEKDWSEISSRSLIVYNPYIGYYYPDWVYIAFKAKSAQIKSGEDKIALVYKNYTKKKAVVITENDVDAFKKAIETVFPLEKLDNETDDVYNYLSIKNEEYNSSLKGIFAIETPNNKEIQIIMEKICDFLPTNCGCVCGEYNV